MKFETEDLSKPCILAKYQRLQGQAYEYAHAGLYVICTNLLTTIRETLKDICSTFEDYETLVPQLEYFKSSQDVLYNKRVRIFEFA